MIIRVERDWGKVTISTVYTLKANADCVGIQTTMNNRGGTALPDLLSGLTLWPKGGYLFSVPGLAGIEQGPGTGALSDRVTAYDETSTVTLHAPYFDHVGFSSKDMYRLHTLAAGESRTFEGWLQVVSNGDLKPVIQAEIERKHLPSGLVRGVVRERHGKLIDLPVVVVEKQGKPYGWVLGNRGGYEFRLPQGDYVLYATAKNYSQSIKTSLTIAPGANETRNFLDLQRPGTDPLLCRGFAKRQTARRTHRHYRRPARAARIFGCESLLHGTRPERPTRRGDRTRRLPVHGNLGWWLSRREPAVK